MLRFVKNNLLVASLLAALGMALVWPQPGRIMAEAGLKIPLIAAILLFQGFALDIRELGRGKAALVCLAPAFLTCFGLAPALGWVVGLWAGLDNTLYVGFIIMCCMPSTIVSGAVLAGQAGGSRAVALLVAVVLNVAGVFLIPLALNLTLSSRVDLPVGQLLLQLVLIVLLPGLVGQALRRFAGPSKNSLGQAASHGSLIGLAVVVYMLLASQAHRLGQLPASGLLLLAGSSFLVHILCLGAALAVSRKVFGLNRSFSLAVAMVSSQKTISLATAVWVVSFAREYPLAILAPLVFHPVQIFADSILAARLGRGR